MFKRKYDFGLIVSNFNRKIKNIDNTIDNYNSMGYDENAINEIKIHKTNCIHKHSLQYSMPFFLPDIFD